jgi:uncharacterized protein YecE (DUF72 family)
LAILLVQLPPKLSFDAAVVGDFCEMLGSLTPAQPVCEPRHSGWFDAEADAFLDLHKIARVAADPAPVQAAAVPGGWRGLSYWRLHGSPRMYRSAYGEERLESYARLIEAEQGSGGDTWCMFDNTASSAAIDDALRLRALVSGEAGKL